ncbi:uncharacterized protein [Porites lutea]|uniref:uncharacterized protein n=1 Tax=Porites lutea TaxID=51062 RepID=UPI003CC586A3
MTGKTREREREREKTKRMDFSTEAQETRGPGSPSKPKRPKFRKNHQNSAFPDDVERQANLAAMNPSYNGNDARGRSQSYQRLLMGSPSSSVLNNNHLVSTIFAERTH